MHGLAKFCGRCLALSLMKFLLSHFILFYFIKNAYIVDRFFDLCMTL